MLSWFNLILSVISMIKYIYYYFHNTFTGFELNGRPWQLKMMTGDR